MTDLRWEKLAPFVRDFGSFPRSEGLGGTDAAAIMGLHPYKTALDVYLSKHGKAPPFVSNSAVEWGTRLEDKIADYYATIKGLDANPYADPRELAGPASGRYMMTPGTLIHPAVEKSWAYGSPDRLILDAEGRWLWGLEVKTCGIRQRDRWGEAGSSKFPQEHLIQCAWYMYIARALCVVVGWEPIKFWDLIVLIAGQDDRLYRIEHDPELEAGIVEEAEAFWYDVENENPPELVARDSKNLALLWDRDDGEIITADASQEDLARQLHELNAEIAELEGKQDATKRALKIIIGEASGIDGRDFSIRWKTRKAPRRVDYAALCEALNPPPELVASFTVYGRPQRPFIFKQKKPKPQGE